MRGLQSLRCSSLARESRYFSTLAAVALVLFSAIGYPAPNRLDLPKVIDVVPRKVHRDVPDRFFSTFGVDTEHLPLGRTERTQQSKIGLPQHPIELQRCARIDGVISSSAGPDILIERLN